MGKIKNGAVTYETPFIRIEYRKVFNAKTHRFIEFFQNIDKYKSFRHFIINFHFINLFKLL